MGCCFNHGSSRASDASLVLSASLAYGFGRVVFAGASNAAFVIDHHSRTVGVVRGSYYSQHRLDGGRSETVWADFRRPAPAEPPGPELIEEHRRLAVGLYETARYLLRHNRKPAAGAVATD